MAMMGQRSKVSFPMYYMERNTLHQVERFKSTFSKTDSLHAKFCSKTGRPVVGDAEWGQFSYHCILRR